MWSAGGHAPRGIMDYLFVEMLLWGKDHGYFEFSLGMTPLSGQETGSLFEYRMPEPAA